MAGGPLVLFGFGAQAVAELLDDVVLQGGGELAADGDEIAIDEIHGGPYTILSSDWLMPFHSASSCLKICRPSGVRR